MIIVAGTMTTAPENRDRVLALAAPCVAATRAEAGCREYVFSPDPDDSGLIRLYERWDDDSALAAHLSTDHIATWRAASANLITGRSIHIFTISEMREL